MFLAQPANFVQVLNNLRFIKVMKISLLSTLKCYNKKCLYTRRYNSKQLSK